MWLKPIFVIMIVEVLSVANVDNQPSTVNNRMVYDLDAIGNMVVPNLGLTMANISAAIGPTLQQMASIGATLNAYFEPLREAMKAFHEYIQKIIQPIRDAFESLTKPLSFLISTRPIYFVPTQPVVQEKRLDRYLMVENDDYGFFVIDGKQLSILHPSSSRCGKLLAALLKHRATVVDYQTLREEVGAGDLDKTFKDLKYQLRQQGVVLDYARPRSYGIALNGLQELQ